MGRQDWTGIEEVLRMKSDGSLPCEFTGQDELETEARSNY